jgi:putative N6-adenine-specific DNA methylase
MYHLYAVTQPGLEPYLINELKNLGLTGKRPKAYDSTGEAHEESGGVEFEASLADLYRANLQLRTANRVLSRLGEFSANGFEELQKKAARLPWQQYLRPGQPVALRVTCRKSRLYHSDAVGREVLAAINLNLGKPSTLVKFDEDIRPVPQLVVVRLYRDVCTISMDTSGASLHRRGYRLETAKAPLRETLAAGLLFASGWDATTPMMDPFCGSGTIAIEAALMACRIAPGKNRRFAFTDWQNFDSSLWQGIYKEAAANELTECPPILASDRDEGAIRISTANAERANVLQYLTLQCQAFSAIHPPADKGWVVTNPPYGVRVSASKDLRNLYTHLGDVLREQFAGWHFGLLCADPILAGHIRVSFEKSLQLTNGGIPVKFQTAII